MLSNVSAVLIFTVGPLGPTPAGRTHWKQQSAGLVVLHYVY